MSSRVTQSPFFSANKQLAEKKTFTSTNCCSYCESVQALVCVCVPILISDKSGDKAENFFFQIYHFYTVLQISNYIYYYRMNTFRSTERSLTILGLKRRASTVNVCRQLQTLGDSTKSRGNRRASNISIFSKKPDLTYRGPKSQIKFFETFNVKQQQQQQRFQSTAIRDIPLCNPKKTYARWNE